MRHRFDVDAYAPHLFFEPVPNPTDRARLFVLTEIGHAPDD